MFALSVCFELFIFAWQIENSAPFHFRYDDSATSRSKKSAVGWGLRRKKDRKLEMETFHI